MNLFGWMTGRTAQSGREENRVARYARFARLFDGWLVRENTSLQTQAKRLCYNFFRPVVTVSATWLAGQPLAFEVESGSETEAQYLSDLWQRSGSDAAFLKSAYQASIYGDACLKIESGEQGAALKWLDPSICFPEFDPHDHTRLVAMVVAYKTQLATGGDVEYRADYRNGRVTVRIDDAVTVEETYDDAALGGPPFVWIPNDHVVGSCFGRSDIEPIVQLVERYEHTALAHFNVLDYHGSPNLAVFGSAKPQQETTEKGVKTTFWFTSPDGRIEMVGWKGSFPAYGDELERLRDAIAEVSEVPRVAFGQFDGSSALSGVALRILYGPIVAKTDRKRAIWGPALERAVWMASSIDGFAFDPDRIHAVWQDPMPGDELAALEALEAKGRLGVSRSQILKELEYSPEEIAAMTAERDADDERTAARRAALFDSGGQERE